MENQTWEENENSWILLLAGIAPAPGEVWTMREQILYNPEAAGDGTNEEDCP